MSDFDKTPWIADAKALLDDSAQALDAATLSRLNRARHAALAQRRARLRVGWFPLAGLATTSALLLAVALWNPLGRGGDAAALAVMPNAADADAAISDDSIEFYQNLEFYAWLEAQDQDNDG